jgi:hypothetical protein
VAVCGCSPTMTVTVSSEDGSERVRSYWAREKSMCCPLTRCLGGRCASLPIAACSLVEARWSEHCFFALKTRGEDGCLRESRREMAAVTLEEAWKGIKRVITRKVSVKSAVTTAHYVADNRC